MFAFSGRISAFVDRHPTMKVLALSFLLLIGATLVAERFDVHLPKGYIYFAMAFSLRRGDQSPRATLEAGPGAPPSSVSDG